MRTHWVHGGYILAYHDVRNISVCNLPLLAIPDKVCIKGVVSLALPTAHIQSLSTSISL